ncbi:MAG: uroporphyrinogen-III synthase [Acidobacteria bacterium]|nr:uroporphyrinogen-III synthase [Acidobacteriota bacterium]
MPQILPNKLLSNLTILLACSEKKMAELAAGIERMGGHAVPLHIIEARDIEDKHLLDAALASLQEYSWIILTSAYGVSFFMKRLADMNITMDAQNMPKLCAIGPATADAVRESGYAVDLIPEKFVAEGIIDALGKYCGGLQTLAGKKVLIPRAKDAREVLPEALVEAGVQVDIAPCYQTVRAHPDDAVLQNLREKNPDLTVFTSSSGIRHLVDLLGADEGRNLLRQSVVAVIGPITYSTAESFGKRPEIIPKENTIASLLQAIRDYYAGRQSAADRPR